MCHVTNTRLSILLFPLHHHHRYKMIVLMIFSTHSIFLHKTSSQEGNIDISRLTFEYWDLWCDWLSGLMRFRKNTTKKKFPPMLGESNYLKCQLGNEKEEYKSRIYIWLYRSSLRGKSETAFSWKDIYFDIF